MDVLFLGTGAGVPSKPRNVTSIALKLLEERGAVWLFDCGEATQHQILHTSLKPRRIEKIFISHLHGDHIYGLPGLLSSRSFQGGETGVTVYGPAGIKEFIETCLKVSKSYLKYPLEIIEIDEGVIFSDGQFSVEAKLLDHGIPSYGFRVTEMDRPGVLLAEKLKEQGVKPGPIYRKIKAGETVVLEDGRVIEPSGFLGPSQKGRIVAILGDTRACENARLLAAGADLLIHEATFSAEDAELAFDYYHSTALQAAEAARDAGAEKLCLTHISSRYGKEEGQMLVEEARAVFANTVLAEDFLEISVPLRNQ